MYFYAEMERNPDLLIDIFSEEDVQSIFETIKKYTDESVCSRIRFEIAIGGSPRDYDGKEPLIVDAYEVLSELHLSAKRDSKDFADFKNLYRYLEKINDLLKKDHVKEMIPFTGDVSADDLSKFHSQIYPMQSAMNNLFIDVHARRKARFENWGTLGRYKVFVRKCADLYCELTGEPFKADFVSQKGESAAITDGTRFAFEFHKLLNRLSAKYESKIFSSQNFATAATEAREAINAEIALRKSLRNFDK